jgi:hypothetical protein
MTVNDYRKVFMSVRSCYAVFTPEISVLVRVCGASYSHVYAIGIFKCPFPLSSIPKMRAQGVGVRTSLAGPAIVVGEVAVDGFSAKNNQLSKGRCRGKSRY